MSVSNPVDSGGLRAFDHDLQGLTEQMNTVGGWAEIMAADSMNNMVKDEEPPREVDIDQQPAGRITNKKGRDPPFMAQILGWQKLLDIEEFYLFLGGSDKVVTIDNGSINKNRLIVTMRTKEDLEELVVKKQIEFKGKPLRVFFENPSPHFLMQPPPGSVRIQQRDISEREQAADMSPLLDPKHPTPSVPEKPTIEHPIETINEEPSPVLSRRDPTTQDNSSKIVIPRPGGQAPAAQKPFAKPRTLQHSGPKNRRKWQHRGRGVVAIENNEKISGFHK